MSSLTQPRRRLLKSVAAAGAGILAFGHRGAPTATAATSDGTRVTFSYEPQVVGRVSDLVVGEPTYFKFPDERHTCMLVKLDKPAERGVGAGEDIVSFSTSCPHMGCSIRRMDAVESMLGPCHCHYSCFDLAKSGLQVHGQATQSAPQILLEVQGDDIVAVGISGLLYGRSTNAPLGAARRASS